MTDQADPLEGALETDDVDFALAAYRAGTREGGGWRVAELSLDHAVDVDSLVGALRRFTGEGGALGLVAVGEDYFVLVRVAGTTTRLLLSDVGAALESELAADVVEHLGLPEPDDDDPDGPAGDLTLLADLGVSAVELMEMLEDESVDDDDLYPDEMLSDIAESLGFGEEFDDVVGLERA